MNDQVQTQEPAKEVDAEELMEKWRQKAKPANTTSTSSADDTDPLCPRCRQITTNFVSVDAPDGRKPIPMLCDGCLIVVHAMPDEDDHAGEARTKREHELRGNMGRVGVNVRKYFDQTPASFDTFEPANARDQKAAATARSFVMSYLSGQRPSLYMFGSRAMGELACGNGKTHLAVSILRDLLLDPRIPVTTLKFVFVPELLMEIQDTFDSPDHSMRNVVNRYATPELLVWDDFGAEKLSDFAIRTIFTILYKREGLSNVFTSNLSLDAVEKRDAYAARITSRIIGDARLVELTGPDRRPLRRAI